MDDIAEPFEQDAPIAQDDESELPAEDVADATPEAEEQDESISALCFRRRKIK